MTTFTAENQEENRISRTTKQSLKHFMYSNITVSISGMNGSHDVWVKTERKQTMRFQGLSLQEAVIKANELIKGEVF